MTRTEFVALRQRFDFACGYCGVSETSAGATLTIDHFQPTSRGGLDEAGNWIYCCSACNTFKGAHWNEVENLRLLKPLQDDFSTHIQSSGVQLVGLTARGTRHIERLRLNREQLNAQRAEAQALEELQQRLHRAEYRLDNALRRIDEASRQ